MTTTEKAPHLEEDEEEDELESSEEELTVKNFGKTSVRFRRARLTFLVDRANKDPNNAQRIEAVKDYVSTYFAKLDDLPAVVRFDGKTGRIYSASLKHEDLRKNHFLEKHRVVKKTVIKGKEYTEVVFDLRKWFFNENDEMVHMVCDPLRPLTSRDDDGSLLINSFGGFNFDYQEPHERDQTHAEEAAQGCALIWAHIKNIICSGNEEMYVYHRAWIVSALNSERTNTCLYWKSGQGTGKSLVVNFLAAIMGAAFQQLDASKLLGNDNSQMRGRTLVCVNEPDLQGESAWNVYSEIMKNQIDGESITLNQKYKTPESVPTLANWIITTNRNAIKMENSDRRYVCPDIAEEMARENLSGSPEAKKYYKTLGELMKNKWVRQLFYNLAVDEFHARKEKFDFTRIPVSEAKDNQVSGVRPALRVFLVEHFLKTAHLGSSCKVRTHKGVKRYAIPFTTLAQEYARSRNLLCDTKFKTALNQELGREGFETFNGAGNACFVDLLGRRELYEKFKRLRWFSAVDEIDACCCSAVDEAKSCDLSRCSEDCLPCLLAPRPPPIPPRPPKKASPPTLEEEEEKGLLAGLGRQEEGGRRLGGRERRALAKLYREGDALAAELEAKEERMRTGEVQMLF